ncbi:hypothetical protein [Mycolicibacter heraklionensis]|uniref:hypothetical protein n=1 Tax=Mycolicibacter heraklionensis TaxID=512402 RepID=UPI0007EAD544|nr:hypothetical protein [Mycolicibacter heraklionensis]OBG32388.1 hypothetical protein A5671_07600 [Mycolicibacter heraklionensis]
MNATEEWVSLKGWVADPPFVQSLIAVTVWPKLTKRQRVLVASCRDTIDPEAEFPAKYRIAVDRLADAPSKTLTSLQLKGVVDEFGRLTVPGIYTALWNQLERDQERREARAS